MDDAAPTHEPTRDVTSGAKPGLGLRLACLSLLAWFACAAASAAEPPPLDAVRRALEPLRFAAGSAPPSAAVRAYWQYYGLDCPGVEHVFGTFRSGSRNLVVHAFLPPSPTATVVLVHGYYDHVGVWRHLVPSLTAAGYAVLAYDQPGHGLSEGERASIGDFSEYVTALDNALALARSGLPPPLHLVAHSLGAGVTLDRLRGPPPADLGRVVLLAPLVRSAHWSLSGLGHSLTPGAIHSLPRVYRDNSADPEFRRFVRQDPLQYDRLPVAFVSAQRAWVRRLDQAQPVTTDLALTVLQGDADTTVDWKANGSWVRRVFPKARIAVLPEAGHQLLNEALPIRTDVVRRILAALAARAP